MDDGDPSQQDTLDIPRSQARTEVGRSPGSRSRPRTQALFEPGDILSDYVVRRRLGQGGMGEVYEAEHSGSGRRVALKLLRQELGGAEDRARFLREGRLAASISHPNSVYVYGTEEIDGMPVISMELVPGGSLADRVKGDGPMAPALAVDSILEVIAGLEAAVAAGILHRDVKPSNCFVDADGAVKVGDFGLSLSTRASAESHLTLEGSFLGTPAFASPEQVRCEDLDVRSDIYSVGATLYFLITGKAPFHDERIGRVLSQVLQQPPEPPRRLNPTLSRGLERVIQRCLEKRAEARFSDYAALRAALLPHASEAPAPASLGPRAAATLVDVFPVAVFAVLVLSARGISRGSLAWERLTLLEILGAMLYLGILESVWGTTPGKALLGLRVVGPDRQAPGILRGLSRAAIFCFAAALPFLFPSAPSTPDTTRVVVDDFSLMFLVLLLFVSARRRNGFAGLHELASGTRVVAKSSSSRPRLSTSSTQAEVVGETRRRIGPYAVRGTLRKLDRGELVEGYDETLRRRVWIFLSAHVSDSAIAAPHPDRPGRIRWLMGKHDLAECWDAFEAPAGSALLDIARPQPWATVRSWLLELASELGTSIEDGSLPESVSLESIWITSDGRAKLLEFRGSARSAAASTSGLSGTGADFSAVQTFLHSLALGSLGREKSPGDGAAGFLVPLSARSLLHDLSDRRFATRVSLTAALEGEQRKPGVVTTRRRLVHIAFLVMLQALWAAGGWMEIQRVRKLSAQDARLEESRRLYVRAVVELPSHDLPRIPIYFALGTAAAFGVLLAYVFRGGPILRLLGIAVVGVDGFEVSGTRAVLRAAVAWIPAVPALIAFVAVLRGSLTPAVVTLADTGLVVLVACAVGAVLRPERGIQDRIAATFLVPR